MSATVHIDELNPATRARVLQQICEPAGTTALATVECSTQLAKLDKARQLLAESRTLPEVKKIRDIAEAAKVYAKAAHLGAEAQNYAAEISLLSERKAGEILSQLEKSDGGRPEKTPVTAAGVSEYRQTLTATQTPERTAQQWQETARVPENIFHGYIRQSKDLELEITRAGLSKFAKKAAARENPTPIVPLEIPKASAADITACLAVLLSKLSALNAFTKQLKYADLDEPSKTEIQTLITQLRKVSKDAAERADRLQAVTL